MASASLRWSQPMPTAATFYDSLVLSLGEATGFTAHVYVPMQDIRDDVLSKHGLDPQNLPHGWPLDGRPSIHRKIDDAFRNQKAGKHFRPNEKALTEPGPKRGLWGLTELGVEKARKLSDEGNSGNSEGEDTESSGETSPETEDNLTARWLSENPRFYGVFLAKVQKKLPASASMGLAADHVHNYVVKLLTRDGLRKKLEKGEKLSVSQVASYCVRSSYTDIRGWGTDAHCRALRGARTEQERKKQNRTKADEMSWGIPEGRLAFHRDESGDAYVDVIDQESYEQQELKDAFTSLLLEVEDLLYQKRPDVRRKYLQVVRYLSEGLKAPAIAERMGETNSWARSTITDLRSLLGDAKLRGQISLAG